MPSTESLESRATRPLRRGSTAATPGLGVTTRSRARAQQESQSQSAARAKLREADGCKKRAKLDGTSHPEPESSKKGKTILDYSQDSQSSGWDWGWGEEDEDGSTSAVSSPIRVPVPEDYMPQTNGDSVIAKANRAMNQAFYRKIGLCHSISRHISKFLCSSYTIQSNQQNRIFQVQKSEFTPPNSIVVRCCINHFCLWILVFTLRVLVFL